MSQSSVGGRRYHKAKNKQSYTRGYMSAISYRVRSSKVSTMTTETGGETFDLAKSCDAESASDWLKGWLDGRASLL